MGLKLLRIGFDYKEAVCQPSAPPDRGPLFVFVGMYMCSSATQRENTGHTSGFDTGGQGSDVICGGKREGSL